MYITSLKTMMLFCLISSFYIDQATATLKVVSPPDLKDLLDGTGDIDMVLGNFGMIPYGRKYVGKMIYTDADNI